MDSKSQEKLKMTNQNQQIQKNQYIKESNSNFTQQVQSLRQQLQSMQFEPCLISLALKSCITLDQSIQFIINEMQKNQSSQKHDKKSNQTLAYFLVRMDLKMSVGKISAQVAHAVLKLFQNARYQTMSHQNKALDLINWMENHRKMQVLEVQTQQDLNKYANMAQQSNITYCTIRDAGRTQIAAGSMTVIGIGPIPTQKANFLSQLKPF